MLEGKKIERQIECQQYFGYWETRYVSSDQGMHGKGIDYGRGGDWSDIPLGTCRVVVEKQGLLSAGAAVS
jgi:hypothetical protein